MRTSYVCLAVVAIVLCVPFAEAQTSAPTTPAGVAAYNGQTSVLVETDGATHAPVTVAKALGWVPIGYAKYTPTTAKALTDACTGTGCVTLPVAAKHAIIQIGTNAVRWRDDGTAPTATLGIEFSAGRIIVIENSRAWLQALRFIDTAAGASEVNVAYYKSAGE